MALFQGVTHALGQNIPSDLDLRGWEVVDDAGDRVGTVDDLLVDARTSALRYVLVDMGNRCVLLPVAAAMYDETARRVRAQGYSRERMNQLREYKDDEATEEAERAHFQQHATAGATPLDYSQAPFRGQLPRRLELLEEQLKIGKHREQVGEASIGKKAVSEQVSQDLTLESETLDISRHAVNRPATGDERITVEGDTIKVPLFAERPDVSKETMVREEVEIGKHTQQHTEHIRDTVRHEELVTQGLDQTREPAFSGTEPTEADRKSRAIDVVPESEPPK